MASELKREAEYLNALFVLTLNPVQAGRAADLVASLTPQERGEFLSLADSHHVIVRGLSTVLDHSTSGSLPRSSTSRPSAMNWKPPSAQLR
jgi:hypothetical protein